MMIDQVGEGNRLTIGEGVETTLAALQLRLSHNRDQPELRNVLSTVTWVPTAYPFWSATEAHGAVDFSQ
jgi:hypothetical protein